MDRIIETGLTTQLQADIIDAVFGQLSDGKWEGSRAMEGYWPYIDVVRKGKNVFLVVSENMKFASRPINKFDDMKDNQVKIWVANKIKEVIKDEGLDWDRGNMEETDYLATKWRKSKKAATVSDCYYVYEVLKGRNPDRHAEYRLKEAVEILKNNGFILEDTDDWDDADLPAGMTQAQRRKWAHRHNSTFDKDFDKLWKKGNHVKDYYDAKDDYERYYGEKPVNYDHTYWGEEGRNLQQKITRAKSFAGSPENNETIAAIFDALKKTGWKYIGAKMGSNKGMGDFAIEKFFMFKKPGKGKKDYVIGWSLYYPDENEKPSKELQVSFQTPKGDGGGTFKNVAAFIEEINWAYNNYMGSKRSYNRHSNEPDYEEMAALDYESR